MNSFPIEPSIADKIEGEFSITSISVPNLPYTEPNSRPITPPPIMSIFLGISFNSNASVEVIMRFLSGSIPGK